MVTIVYLNIKSKKILHREKSPSYIPNINETIIINDDNEVIKWLVINKIINIYPTDNNYVCVNIYVKQI